MFRALVVAVSVMLAASAATAATGKGGRGSRGGERPAAARSGAERGSAAAARPETGYESRRAGPSAGRGQPESRRVFLKPDPKAKADHTVFKRNNAKEITRYETYRRPQDTRDPRPFALEKSVDLNPDSKPHYDKATNQAIPAPHVNERGRYRTARPEEIPRRR